MSQKKNPSLRSIGPDLWILQRENLKPLVGDIRMTMTLIRLPDGRIILISPVPLDVDDVQDIRLLGRVQWIVAPNSIHHRYLDSMVHHFPEAELWGSLDLTRKRADLKWVGVLSNGQLPPWGGTVDVVALVAEPPVCEEFVFFHRDSSAIIFTDVAFHLPAPKDWMGRLVLAVNGGWGELKPSRWARSLYRDRTTLELLRQAIDEWPIERVVVAHGEPLADVGSDFVLQSLSRLWR